MAAPGRTRRAGSFLILAALAAIPLAVLMAPLADRSTAFGETAADCRLHRSTDSIRLT